MRGGPGSGGRQGDTSQRRAGGAAPGPGRGGCGGGRGAPGGGRKGLKGSRGRGLTLPVLPAGRVREMSGFDSFTTDFFQTGYSIDEQAQHYDYGGGGGRAYGR